MFGRYKKVLMDIMYSIISYALPTVMLQMVAQPFIAARLTGAQNDLFLTLLSAVRLGVNVFISVLANLRLLEKKNCQEEPRQEKNINFMFCIACTLCLLLAGTLTVVYCDQLSWSGLALVLLVAALISFHDYYAICFRVSINYRKVMIDNALIVVGYGVGLLWFLAIPRWEVVFISGYLFGSVYVLISSDMWKKGLDSKVPGRLYGSYAALSASSALTNSITYCDKLLMYPMLESGSVSSYNAAAVVSKIISIVTVPLRNVLLSYVVNRKKLVLPRKQLMMLLALVLGGSLIVYGGGYGVSHLLCSLLYPMYYGVAKLYIPIIMLSIVFESLASLGKVLLMPFAKASLQTIISAVKLGTYVLMIILLELVFPLDLLGFCLASLLANTAMMLCVFGNLLKHIELTYHR